MNNNPSKKFDLFFLLLLILVSGYFRFINLAQNPGIYNDEGTLLNISINLHNGRAEYLGILGSWLLAARMPVIPWLLSLSYSFFEPSLLVLRTLSASCGVLSAALLFLFLRKISDKQISYLRYLAPVIFALHPKFVLFNRIGFGYNFLIPLTILVFWFVWSYIQSQKNYWLIFASILVGIGTLIELAYIACVVLLAIWVILFAPRRFFVTILVALSPLLIYFLISFALFGESFLFDWQTTFDRGTSNSLLLQFASTLVKTSYYLIYEISFLIGIVGCMNLQLRKFSIATFLGITLPLLVITRTLSPFMQSFYYLLPYTPFVSIGISGFIYKITEGIVKFSNDFCQTTIFQILPDRLRTKFKLLVFSWITIVMMIIPATFIVDDLNTQVRQSFTTSFDHLFIDIQEFYQVTNYLSQTLRKTETVIASPAIAWAINANTTDYQISIAVNEQPTIHFPNGIPKDRMRFSSDMDNAAYVIIDSILRSWKDNQIPNIEEWVDQIETEWIPVFQTKSILVYRNPNLLEK